jgi:adenylate cyclase
VAKLVRTAFPQRLRRKRAPFAGQLCRTRTSRALFAKAASEFEAEGLAPFAIRFGIHLGDAAAGNVGSADRVNYTVLGNSVNQAARLEGLNKEYGSTILVRQAVRNRVENCLRFNPIASVIAKSMTIETRVCELAEAIA